MPTTPALYRVRCRVRNNQAESQSPLCRPIVVFFACPCDVCYPACLRMAQLYIVCLRSARKRKKNKTSNYLISLDDDDLARKSGNFFGKVRSNFIGTEFTM